MALVSAAPNHPEVQISTLVRLERRNVLTECVGKKHTLLRGASVHLNSSLLTLPLPLPLDGADLAEARDGVEGAVGPLHQRTLQWRVSVSLLPGSPAGARRRKRARPSEQPQGGMLTGFRLTQES